MPINVWMERLRAHNAGKNVWLVPEKGTHMYEVIKAETEHFKKLKEKRVKGKKHPDV